MAHGAFAPSLRVMLPAVVSSAEMECLQDCLYEKDVLKRSE